MKVIYVEPVPQARIKAAYRNGKVWTYRAKGNKAAEDAITLAIKSAGFTPFAEHIPLKLTVTFYRTKPVSSKDSFPCRKPDLDNYVKTIGENLTNAGIIQDDSQITTIVASKKWSTGTGYIEYDLEIDK
jgi:Holliday junction resolvase RusA-like endonuclease